MPRPKGSKNKKTIEREERERITRENAAAMAAIVEAEKAATAGAAIAPIAERVLTKKLGKDILEDFANLFAGMAAFYQPWPSAQGKNPNEDERKFREYSALAVQAATALTPFQSPRLSAVAIGAAIVNKVEVTGGMPDDFRAPTPEPGKVIEFKPGAVVTPDDVKADGAAVA